MAVLFYFHRVCCPCKGINFHWPRSISFHGTVNSLQDSLIISWKNIFYTLFMSCLWTVSQHGAHILLILLFRCVKCSEKMTCANCTTSSALFEEEWKTRNKYSFGVKSSRSGQSFFCMVNQNPLYSHRRSYANTMVWGSGRFKLVVDLPGCLNTPEVLSDGLNNMPSTCLDNWLMR